MLLALHTPLLCAAMIGSIDHGVLLDSLRQAGCLCVCVAVWSASIRARRLRSYPIYVTPKHP